jgi:gamma-aminobutyric acid receptor subunit beta
MLLTCLFVSCNLSAQGLDSTQRDLIAERPSAQGAATKVDIGVYVIDFDRIDDVNQRFSLDMFVKVTWQDQRLALPEAERTGQIRSFARDEVWVPRVLIVNDRGLTNQLPLVVDVDDAGNVELRSRLTGELAGDLQFQEFPFDVQRLPIDVVSYQYSAEELRFAADSTISGDDGGFSIEGWRVRILEPEFGEYAVQGTELVRPRLTFFLEAERVTEYYLLTMFVPMSLIIFMSWMVFWLQPEIVPSRIALSTGAIFSMIAFGFTIRLSLPQVSYMTRADMFVLGCTMLVFLALGAAVIGSRWASGERKQQALRLNAVARWFYVLLYCAVVFTAFNA